MSDKICFTYVSEGSTAQFLNRMHQMDSTQIAEFGNIPFTYTTQYDGNGKLDLLTQAVLL